MLKILQVMAGAAHGGAETAFVDLCIALHEAGAIIEIVTRNNSPDRLAQLRAAGLTVHCLPFGGVADLFTPWAMRRIIRRFQPSVVQTWMARAAHKTPRWTALCGAARYTVVSRLGGYYKLKYFRSTDAFVTITPDIKRWLESQGFAPERIVHINNFAETEADANPAPRAAENTPDHAPLLLALGRLHTAKGFDVLLRAMAMLPGVYLWIAGEGPERSALEKQIAGLDLADRVRLLGWRNDRAALFKAANICVFPSRYEPFGTVFVQAWANRIPLVTTDADGPGQFVRPGEDGLVIPINDAPALAVAVKKLIESPGLMSALVEAGYERYLIEFSKQKTVESYLQLYENIAKR